MSLFLKKLVIQMTQADKKGLFQEHTAEISSSQNA